jgi:glycosyltransferase involved in cell wall biosynthesis
MDNLKPQLYLNMIVEENEPVESVRLSIDSVKEYVDGMYITVTYRDKKPDSSALIDLLHQYKAELSFFQWVDDFAKARNFALEQVPKGPNIYIYWQDADDQLVQKGADNLRTIFEDAYRRKWAGVFFVYWYRVELDKDNNVKEILIEQQRERIIRNDGTYKWVGMLHETLIGQRIENFQQFLRKDCIVVHLTNDARVDKALERNIRILEAQLTQEKHRDPRTLVYLAKAYYDKGLDILQRAKDKEAAQKEVVQWHNKALELFDEYLKGKGEMGDKDYIEQSGWYEERASGWQYVSQIYLIREEFNKALGAINQAIEEAPRFPHYYIDKAVIYTHLNDFVKAKHWLTVGVNVELPETTLMLSPRDMKVRTLECDAQIALHEQNLKRASEDYNRLLAMFPDSDFYKERLTWVDSLEAANKGMQSIVYLGKYLEQTGEKDKIPALLNATPQTFRNETFYAQMRHLYVPPRIWEKNEIAILCGPGFEDWSPKSIEKGLGGSEEAVVYMSQELKKLGWKVTVYAHPGEEGDYDGVQYLNYYQLNVDDLFNHLILWRGIGFVDIKPKVTGKIILWLHDMPNIGDFTEERLKRIDKIAVLSQYHRDQIKQYNPNDDSKPLPIPDNKFFITRNGIPDLGITTWEGNPHRMCYISSYDRGLIYLLKNWKIVREKVPDAELEIYYGFDLYDYIHRNNPAKMAFKEKILTLMKQDGITHHGRVGHKALAEGINRCGVWTYPTDFTEISCISAMKCQALGAIPVVTNFAALKETVKNGLKIDVDIQAKEGQAEYFKVLGDFLLDTKKQEDIRKGMMPWAQEYYSWSRVANEWQLLLQGVQGNTSLVLTPEEWQKRLGAKKDAK